MNDATNGSAGRATSSWVLPICRRRPSTSTPTRRREGGRILEVVRDEERGDVELGQELLQLAANGRLGAAVERGQRLVQQQHLRVAREGSRQRDPLPLSPGELGGARGGEVADAEALEVGVRLVTARELDVLANGQVREERVVLEEEADGALVYRSVDPARRVEPGLPADLDPPFPWTHEPGDRAQDRRLARAGGADQGDRPVDLQRQPEVEGPKRNQDLVEERGHERRSRRVRSRARLKTTSTALMATAASKWPAPNSE